MVLVCCCRGIDITMFIRTLISLILLLVGCGTDDKEELNLIRNKQGVPFHWNSSDFPLTVFIPDTLDRLVVNVLHEEVDGLNKDVGCDLFGIEVQPEANRKFYGMPELLSYQDVVFQVNPVSDKERAHTEVFLIKGDLGRQGIMYSADISMSPSTQLIYMNKVIRHELLHVLGLDHDSSKRSVMYISAEDSNGYVEKVDLEYVRNECKGLTGS